MRIAWYYHRLRSMSAGEILWRVRKKLWRSRAKVFRARWARRYEGCGRSVDELRGVLSRCRFFGLREIRPEDVPEEWRENARAEADRILQHRFRYFALGEMDLGPEIRWNHEYKRGIDLPLAFGPGIDYRDVGRYGDFKYFWEVPRLQHLIPVAKAYFLTRDEKYAQEVVSQLEAFLDSSPYLLGVNWTMPMEASIRLVSLSWILQFIKESPSISSELCRRLEQAIRLHADYPTATYARFSSANNHLIGEAAGVFIASVCFPCSERIQQHGDAAYRILCHEAQLQFHPDGVNKEQATHYQVFAHMFLLLAGLLGRANGKDFPAEYWNRLERSADFLAAMTADRGALESIGDSDDGNAVLLSPEPETVHRTILATSAALFARQDLKRKAGTFDDASFWLLGPRGRETFERIQVEEPAENEARAFPEGGYYVYVSRSPRRFRVVFDCGPLGYQSIAAHGHADALSVLLEVGGRPILIDPGTYTYVATDPYREYFRSTMAHNTVVVDGESQSESRGPFLWGRKARAFQGACANTDDLWRAEGWHDGYAKLPSPVTHRRRVDVHKATSSVEIVDRLEGEGRHEITQCFHFAPGCQLREDGAGSWWIESGLVRLRLTADPSLEGILAAGVETSIAGWSSEAYDQKTESPSLFLRRAVSGTVSLTTTIDVLSG